MELGCHSNFFPVETDGHTMWDTKLSRYSWLSSFSRRQSLTKNYSIVYWKIHRWWKIINITMLLCKVNEMKRDLYKNNLPRNDKKLQLEAILGSMYTRTCSQIENDLDKHRLSGMKLPISMLTIGKAVSFSSYLWSWQVLWIWLRLYLSSLGSDPSCLAAQSFSFLLWLQTFRHVSLSRSGRGIVL